ncbi:MAG: hypothetical protein ACI8XO_001249 [Verrucomicrobiales bacterium]|jgi:hypothetical protein
MDPRRQKPAPSEKDRYTYDEMMDRLRSQRSGSGGRQVEIEGPDGTVEVKKRKRRSHQPKKAKEELIGRLKKRLLITAVPIVLLLIGGYLLINVRYQSDGFSEGVSERTSQILGVKTEFAPFVVKGLIANNRRMFIEPSVGTFLQNAEFTSLQGDLTAGSMLSSSWHLNRLDAMHGKLLFQAPSQALAASDPEGNRIRLVGAGLGLSSKPEAFDIDLLRVDNTDFIWTNGRKFFTFIKGATVTSLKPGARTKLQLTNAELDIDGWPKFHIDWAKLDLGKGQIRINDALLKHHYVGMLGGEASVRGVIDLSKGASGTLICGLEQMPVASLIAKEWIGRLEGTVEATLNFEVDFANLAEHKVSGPFMIRNGSFGDVTPTSRLAAFLAEPRISRVQFHSIKGDINLERGVTTVTNLKALSPDFVQVTGNYSIQPDGILSGTLGVAITDKILNNIPGGKPKFFGSTDPTSAMSSVSVQIGGTSHAPTDDLTPRIEAAIEQHKIETAAPPASAYPTIQLAPGVKKKADQPDSAAKKAAEDAFNQLIEP